MNEAQSSLWRLLASLVLAVALLVVGWKLMPTEGSWGAIVPILGGMLCFLLAACIVAIPLARWFAEPWGSLYFSNRMAEGKAPMYGIPQSKRKKGLFEEAMTDYEAIVREHPGELRAYVEMMDMAVVNLKDRHRAERIYEQGMLIIQNEDDRRALGAMHRAISSRLADRRSAGKAGWNVGPSRSPIRGDQREKRS